MSYEPEVNDYVVWDRGEYGKDEGWVYFKGDPVEEQQGFPTPVRYITIETAYSNGIAVLTVSKGGLMYEASIGGQKFSYEAYN